MKRWLIAVAVAITLSMNCMVFPAEGRNEVLSRKWNASDQFKKQNPMASTQAIAFLKSMLDNLNKANAGVASDAQGDSSPIDRGEQTDFNINESGRMMLVRYKAGHTPGSEAKADPGAAGGNLNDISKEAKRISSFYLSVMDQNSVSARKSTTKEVVLRCLAANACVEEIIPGAEKSRSSALTFRLADDTSDSDIKKTIESFKTLIKFYSRG